MSKQVQCVLVALGVCLLGSAIVGMVTLAEWPGPTTPTLIMLGAALLPAVLGGLLVMSPPDQHPWTRQILMTGALPGVIFGLVAVAVGFSWTAPQVRANAASKLSPAFQETTPLLRALNDSADAVAVAACQNLARNNFEQVYGQAISTISNRPKVAVECFHNPGPNTNDIIFRLSENWHRALLNHDSDAEVACELSDALGTIASNHPVNAAQLTDCALQSRDPRAQQCCTQALNKHTPTSQELANKLNNVPEMLVSFTLATKLISASFSGNPRLGSISLETPGFQKIALLTACSSLQHDSNKTVTAFYQLAQTLECMPPSETPPTNLMAWTRICKEMTPQLAPQTEANPRNLFCDMLAQDNKLQDVPPPEISPEEADAMAQLAAGIEYAAHSNLESDYDDVFEGLGFGKAGVDFDNMTPDGLVKIQELMNANLGKPQNGEPLSRKELVEINKLLNDSKNKVPEMLDTLDKKKDLTKEQRESLKNLRKDLEDNPNLFNPSR